MPVNFEFSTYVACAATYLKLPLLNAFGQVMETGTVSVPHGALSGSIWGSGE